MPSVEPDMPTRGAALAIAMHILALVLITVLLAGCASTSADMTSVRPPEASLMTPPKAAPPIKAGTDLRKEYAKLRGLYGAETGRLSHLQRYVTATRGGS